MNSRSNPDVDAANERSPSRKRWKHFGRLVLFALGVSALASMIHHVGTDAILAAVARTAAWLPLICILDFAWVVLEGGAVLSVYGEQRKRIPVRVWLYVSFVHYTTFMLLPVGRASAEVARAALIKDYVDRDLAAVGAALMQSLTMISNGLVSLIAACIVYSLVGAHALAWALWTNVALMFVLGGLAYAVLRHGQVGGFLARKFERMRRAGPGFDRQFLATRASHAQALGFCFLGRCLQTVQYGVIVMSVTGHFSIAHAWVSEGIQIVARSAGDFIPNQVGVTEGAFVYFRDVLGLAAVPVLAMTVALVARISNVTVASICAALAPIWPRPEPAVVGKSG